ncbi:hypothetical protein [Aureispira anguillae]|uniref:DUF3575 domain-containing protein n=1 Tax=Aureispira anguillae TaxID=2864201 RepID=A0A916DNW2_9BACT|nr:hypothetical protein [Aureispira anguillae]BDS10149.1 hypothetical protein AsAng_0008570 [Aureispira anguillae]
MNKKLRTLTVLLAIAILGSYNCQTMAQSNSNVRQEGKIAIKLDYFGELVLHPGLSLGIDYTLSAKKWVTIHWDTELGGYWHRWNHTALFTKTSIGARFPIWSFFVDLNLGVGYMHSFPAGEIYQRTTDGGLEKAPNWGHPHFMPTCSVLLGWDGIRKKQLPWRVYIGAEIYCQSGFNHIFLPHAAAKVGVNYQLKR